MQFTEKKKRRRSLEENETTRARATAWIRLSIAKKICEAEEKTSNDERRG